jgi:Domain of unknown function (DUF4167)
MRGRPNNNRKGPNPLTRSYESSGPDVKIRGTAHHIGEKYLQLARDAQSSGDPVTAESYLQHAEHYFRLIAVAQQAQQQSAVGYQRQPGEAVAEDIDDGDDFTGIPDRFASPPERFASPQPTFAQPPQSGGQQPSQDRPFYGNGGNGGNSDKQGYERQDRGPRQDRPFQDKQPYQQDKPYQERSYQDRSYSDRNGQDRQDRNAAQDRSGSERNGHGRDQDNRNQRSGRGPRDFRNDAPRNDQRNESRPPIEDAEPKGLPAFITAPVRAPSDSIESEPSVETFAAVAEDHSEVADREANGFHLRPRRRRRSKAEMAIDQAANHEETGAKDPVGD